MDYSDSLYIGLIIAGFTVSVGGLALLHPGLADDPADRTDVTAPAHLYTVSGERYTVHPAEFYTVCPGTDCIPALYSTDVSFETVEEADEWLRNGDLVASITIDDERYVFPLRVLQHHFVANTVINDVDLVMTYDPFSGHPAAYSRTVSPEDALTDRTLTFSVSGQLWNGNLLIQDQDTETYWSQYTGEAVYGEYTRTQLDQLDIDLARWSLWRDAYPNSTVLSRPSIHEPVRYDDNPYTRYQTTRDVPVKDTIEDTRLHPKDVVYGVSSRDHTTAYREPHIRSINLIQDRVSNVPIMLVQDQDTGAIHGYDRRVDGEPREFTFDTEHNRLHDDTGTVWTPQGDAVDGPSAGTTLQRITLERMYWFSWTLFHPDTELYS